MAQIADAFKAKCSYSPALMVSALVDSMPHPLVVRDMDYEIVLSNKAAQDYYAADLLHCKCYDAGGLKECLCSDCPAREAVRTGKPVEREVRHPGTGDYLIIGIYPMFDDQGRACGIIETARDVTEMRHSIDKIRSLLGQVTAQNQELVEWRRGFEYELKAAREIQQMLVPDRAMCVGGLCFDFIYRPSGEIGGDYHDVFPLDDGRVGLLVSDASGHGVGAALVAVILRMAFRSPALPKGDPAHVLRQLNDELVRVIPPGQFATAFYGVYDASQRTLRFASAGHPVPLHIRAESDTPEPLRQGGLVLGTVDGIDFEEHALEFSPADKLLIYTDGVLDAADRDGQYYGRERLERRAAASANAHGRQFLQDVVQDIEQFMAGTKATDDMTLVLAEGVHGSPHEQGWEECELLD